MNPMGHGQSAIANFSLSVSFVCDGFGFEIFKFKLKIISTRALHVGVTPCMFCWNFGQESMPPPALPDLHGPTFFPSLRLPH